MCKVCVACNVRYDGDNHHCSEDYERRREAAEKSESTDYDRRAYGTKLEEGFSYYV